MELVVRQRLDRSGRRRLSSPVRASDSRVVIVPSFLSIAQSVSRVHDHSAYSSEYCWDETTSLRQVGRWDEAHVRPWQRVPGARRALVVCMSVPLEVPYLFCPSMGLPACFRVLSNAFPPTLLFSCGLEPPAVLLAVDFTASPPFMVAADMAAPLVVKGRCSAVRSWWVGCAEVV